MRRLLLISLILIVNISYAQKALLYFKDSYDMYLVNSYRYAEFDQQGLYTEAQLDDLINNQNYIPVATEKEFDDFDLATSQTMGSGTKWEGSYTTGLDKKYVQIYNLDFTSYGNVASKGVITGTYDGNQVLLGNITSSGNGLFGNPTGTLLNCKLDINYTASTGNIGGFIVSCNGANITNCTTNATISGTSNLGGFVYNMVSGSISNCHSAGSISGTLVIGGFVGLLQGGTISDCSTSVATTGSSSQIGGFCGAWTSAGNGLIEECKATGTVSNTGTGIYTGGFIGINYGEINNCYATGSTTSLGDRVGGFAGANFNANASLINCYSIGSVSGVGTLIGGLCGISNATITACYYDSTTSGQSDTGKGVPKTTTEMQQGSIPDTTIYVGWSSSIWDAVDNTSYPELISLQ